MLTLPGSKNFKTRKCAYVKQTTGAQSLGLKLNRPRSALVYFIRYHASATDKDKNTFLWVLPMCYLKITSLKAEVRLVREESGIPTSRKKATFFTQLTQHCPTHFHAVMGSSASGMYKKDGCTQRGGTRPTARSWAGFLKSPRNQNGSVLQRFNFFLVVMS